MIWKKTERVQNVSALLCQGIEISPVLERLILGPKPFRDIDFAQGKNWQVIFGKTLNSEEVLLPHVDKAQPLFQVFPDIWMSVGSCFNLPNKIQTEYIEKIRSDHALTGKALIISPDFSVDIETTDKAEIFVIEQKLPVSKLGLGLFG